MRKEGCSLVLSCRKNLKRDLSLPTHEKQKLSVFLLQDRCPQQWKNMTALRAPK